MTPPVFVVVGHPNKGKSSIVATLAQDDSVRIAAEPGTTMQSRHFPMRVDDSMLYILVDTPGFQRARRALAWLREHETTAADHPRAVRDFVISHADSDLFHDEAELLTPILDGGGILYVVDGSKPFGPEYEPEMEILRWTGQPSMALINPVAASNHIPEWETALGQYFKIVRVFNAVTAEHSKRLELLRAFGQLREDWREPMSVAVDRLERNRRRQLAMTCETVTDLLVDLLTLTVSRNLTPDTDPRRHHDELEGEFKDRIRRAEERARKRVEQIYEHRSIERSGDDAAALETDLFSADSWHLFGQSKWRLAAIGAAGGAAAGALIDASIGGISFLVGTAVGGVVGGALGWQTAEWTSSFELFNLPGMEKLGLSGKRLQCGPTKNRNLPFVALGRARLHHRLVAQRCHARRDVLALDSTVEAGALNPLSTRDAKRLDRIFHRLREAGGNTDRAWQIRDDLGRELKRLFESDHAAPAEQD